jgi:adenylate kinase
MGVIELGGVHGVGKSTTIEAASRLIDRPVPILKGSVIMARILGVSTEDLPRIQAERRQWARELMFDELNTARNGVRDGHFSVYSDQGYEFPFTSTDIGIVNVAVVIEASKETILDRRYRIERDRPKDINQIEEQLLLERFGAEETARKLDVPLYSIRNEDGDNAAEQLAEIFEKYLDK